MFLSIFDVFKIGIGPSSSHTMGPMTAAARFLDILRKNNDDRVSAVSVSLHGSLAFTGKGHATDRAVTLGLLGFVPAMIDLDEAEERLTTLSVCKKVKVSGLPTLSFDPDSDLIFEYGPPLPGHSNGMIFRALAEDGTVILEEIFYSIGGGFVLTAEERQRPREAMAGKQQYCPYPFDTAATMLAMARESGLSIAAMKRANEEASTSAQVVEEKIQHIWHVMNGCIERGLALDGLLPGGLNVRRRARGIFEQLCNEHGSNCVQPHTGAEWLGVYAMAVNEENAAGGKVVTAPTNGAAGVVPGVLKYYLDHCVDADPTRISDFLLTAAAIGGLIKHNASISGAEAGCQGEVGSAAAMAAAGLCAVLGGTPDQVENAAEIALEHHLGMTCDPVAGLVQVPCIERNGIGATKAVAAASLALRGNGSHFMPLDNCIEAMRQTGEEMNAKFKETSLGGLAVNLPEC